jgi:predicted lipoprotein with Yx(FWY)xxD motif
MIKPSKAVVAGAAIAGLLTGSLAVRAYAASTAPTKAGVPGQTLDAEKGKHSCKGKNDCKGQGGCKTGDNGCKAKNSCKGKGGCATDGSKPQAK